MKVISVLCGACALLFTELASASDRLVPSQYPTIQAAINAAVNGDVVQISPGTHIGPVDFKGKAITVRGSTDASTVVISGGMLGSPVVRIWSGESGSSVLDGVTVTGGRGYQDGGGIAIENSSPTISNCRIIGNQTGTTNPSNGNTYGGSGAGILIRGGAPVITNCIIGGNTGRSGGYGAATGSGICVQGASAARLQSCSITGNKMEGGNDSFGAGIYIEGSSTSEFPTFEDCVISGNSLSNGGDGAAMFLTGPAALTRCRISQNGGGVVNRISATQVLLRDCNFCGTNATITGPFMDLGGNRFPPVCDACTGDLNSDGKIDGADLGILLSKWGPCSN